MDLKVAVRRIIVGKWGCNNGQACISPDYIIVKKEYAPELVKYLHLLNQHAFLISVVPSKSFLFMQVDTLKSELEMFYGKNPLESKDLSRIVNSNHFSRLTKLLDEDKVSGKIVHGGERDKTNL